MKNDSIARYNDQKCKLQEIILPEWVYKEKLPRRAILRGFFISTELVEYVKKRSVALT